MTELEKLKWAAEQVEALTEGRLAFRAGEDAWYIAQPEGACLWLSFDKMPPGRRPDRGAFAFNVMLFGARRGWVDASLLRKLAAESPALSRVVSALEQQRYDPSPEDLAEFQKFLEARQKQTVQTGPELGQTF